MRGNGCVLEIRRILSTYLRKILVKYYNNIVVLKVITQLDVVISSESLFTG